MLRNQSSDFVADSNTDPIDETDSGLTGNRNNRIREDDVMFKLFNRSYSSIIFSRSSSVVTEINESRSSFGN
ncbi:hypothetical protein HanPSC8_Chr17g0794021 [Helianthus annuus]|nr:hypothetical protein HanPSC8_Chr17g0794021 [Helianthus annuus]